MLHSDQISVLGGVVIPIVEPVSKEECGRNKGKVKPIPKADRGIGKRVSQMVLKMSEKFIQPGSGM